MSRLISLFSSIQSTQRRTVPSMGLSIAAQIAADMSSPGDAAAHGIASWPSSQGAWSGVAASGLREEYVLPNGWNAVAGWGQIYRDTSNATDTNTRVEIKDFVVYSRSDSGIWQLIQSGADIGGGAFPEDFSSNDPGDIDKISITGGVSVLMIPGRNFHFWPAGSRGALNPSTYDGVYMTFQTRKVMNNLGGTDDRGVAKYLMDVGGDYWLSSSASYSGFNGNNKEIGYSRFKYITNEWQSVRFTNVPDSQISTNPPPL